MTLPSVPVSSLQMSWFLHCGDWHFSCTSARVPSVLPTVSSVFISSLSKYSSLWLSVSFDYQLSVEDGLILKSQRIILTKSSHAAALEQIHYAHQGAEKCKLRANAAVFWWLWHRPCTSLSSGLLFHIRDK